MRRPCSDAVCSGSRPGRSAVSLENRVRPPSSARWLGAPSRLVAFGLAGATGFLGCGGVPDAPEDGRTYFAESRDSAYEIRSLGAHLDQLDERVSFGSIADILATPRGYVVADGLNQRLVLLDRNLDPVWIAGRQGDGPGEYQFPNRMVYAADQLLVLDIGAGHVSTLTPDGDFITRQRIPGNANDIAAHPALGLLAVSDAFPDHYLVQVTAEGDAPFGAMPDELRVDYGGVFQLPVDLVTVTPDGLIHILDGDQLALVSYRPDGGLVGIVFLPAEMRARELRETRERTEAFGGPERMLGTQIVTGLTPLEDGRVFARITSEHPDGLITKGLVLDLERLAAIPLIFPAGRKDWRWRLGSGVYLDGMDRLVLQGPMGDVGLFTAQVELVTRER